MCERASKVTMKQTNPAPHAHVRLAVAAVLNAVVVSSTPDVLSILCFAFLTCLFIVDGVASARPLFHSLVGLDCFVFRPPSPLLLRTHNIKQENKERPVVCATFLFVLLFVALTSISLKNTCHTSDIVP